MPSELRIRTLGRTDADVEFLGRMLVAALLWRPGPPPLTSAQVLAHAEARKFNAGWGRPGDLGLVAEVEGRPVGAAWYRHFTEDEHGEGFVDTATPEIVVAVDEGWRGRGIGRRLLQALHARAAAAGVRRLSLSADLDNPARRLYAALGYRAITPDDPNDRMVLDLD